MKKVFSVILSLAVMVSAFSLIPLEAAASQEGSIEMSMPVYDSQSSNESAVTYEMTQRKQGSWFYETAALLRDAMAARKTEFYFSVPGSTVSDSVMEDNFVDLFYYASSDEISQTSVDGDYILYNLEGLSGDWSYDYDLGGYYCYMEISYYDTTAQEREINEVVSDFINSAELDNISDYDLLKKIHDFVVLNCTYKESRYCYSSYGSLVTGYAVCQGYALAFYRLCKEAGFDVRIVGSDPEIGCHAWNIVRLGDKYYYVDCTWDDPDSGNTVLYDYFLVNYENLQKNDSNYEHVVDENDFGDEYYITNYENKISSSDWNENAADISNYSISYGEDFDPNSVTVTNQSGSILQKGTDYTLSASSDDYMLMVSGVNGKSGYSTRKAEIYDKTLSVTQSCTYDGMDQTPSTYLDGLTSGVDYSVIYSDNVNAGNAQATAYGTGKYIGFTSAAFAVNKADINNFNINLSFTKTYYNGSVQKPTVTVDDIYTTDYSVTYDAIKEPGTGYVYISGKNNCYGTAVRSYEIAKYDISEKSISIKSGEYEYTGGEIKPSVYVSGCVEGVDYDLVYSSNIQPGTASVTVVGKNCFTGSKTLYFTIVKTSSSSTSKPKKVTIKKLKSTKKSITVYWKKISSSGYQIQYSTKKNFKKSKKITVKSGKTTSKKIKKLKSGKKYYVRIRAYKTVNGKKVYGKWSAKKSVTCK